MGDGSRIGIEPDADVAARRDRVLRCRAGAAALRSRWALLLRPIAT